ncbi:MAG: gamma-glutamyltransferase family protein [Armatimonadota bacterium]
MFAKVMTCPEPPAADVGARVFRDGGTAIDAAVAAAFAQAVTNPLGTGIGGMAHILILRAGWTEPLSLNASVEIGSLASTDAFEADFIGRSERAGRYLIRDERNQFGYQSIMTPGFVRGMESVLKEGGGRLEWNRLVSPAVELASEGFAIYPYLEKYYTLEGPSRPGYPDIYRKLAADTLAGKHYLPGGSPVPLGALMRQPEYGRTLERVASQGPDEFYAGAVGREMAADLSAHDAFVTADNLATYTVRTGAPISGTFRDVTIYSAPPPSHGLILLAMLNLVEALPLESMEWNSPDYIETIAWATRTAFTECIPYLGDPLFVTVPVEWLTSKERLSAMKPERATEWTSAPVMPADGHTTHLSAADRYGNVVSITHSIGSITGAGVVTPSLGFLYNNFLGQFNVLRGYHDSIAPGKRMGGGCPSILFKGGRPWMAIGSSGGPRLISAVFQTILNAAVFGMALQEAVSAPRVHSEQGRRIYAEPAFGGRVADTLARRGYEVVLTPYMGCNQAVGYGPQGLDAGSDPRGDVGIGAA